MKKLVFVLAIGVSFAKAQFEGDTRFDWLIGKWEAQTKEGKFFEYWRMASNKFEANGGELIKSDTVFKEYLTLTKKKGRWCYTAEVGKQGPVDFLLKQVLDKTFTFENKKHDFPQQIIYEYIDKDHFKARVEGVMKGKAITEIYDLKRIK